MLGFWPYAKQVSIGVPTGKPAIRRPPEMQSIIANSSATRVGGLYSANELPITHKAVSLVRRANARGDQIGRGHQPIAVRVVLVDADRVEPTFGGEFELVHEVVVHVMRAPRVEQRGMNVDPHRGMLLTKILREL